MFNIDIHDEILKNGDVLLGNAVVKQKHLFVQAK